jgi:hypothetical protein
VIELPSGMIETVSEGKNRAEAAWLESMHSASSSKAE